MNEIEDGYQYAIDDLRKWMEINKTQAKYVKPLQLLKANKKERFHPEPFKKCSNCRWAPKCEGDQEDNGENCSLYLLKNYDPPIKPLEFPDGGRTRELLKQLQEMINKTFEDIIEMEKE